MGNDILLQTGLSTHIVDVFMATFHAHKATIASLKQSFSANKASYHDLAWRLDVELGRRNMHVLAEPVYMVRLDLKPAKGTTNSTNSTNNSTNNSTSASHQPADPTDPANTPQQAPTGVHSYHLQADYANMKKLQDELQRAVDSLNSAHCQRLSRYIS
jgi:hypothetical protein